MLGCIADIEPSGEAASFSGLKGLIERGDFVGVEIVAN
jgi:hypothetical protein